MRPRRRRAALIRGERRKEGKSLNWAGKNRPFGTEREREEKTGIGHPKHTQLIFRPPRTL